MPDDSSLEQPPSAGAHSEPAFRLAGLPVSLFGSVMGLTGLSAAWRSAQSHLGTPVWIPELIAAAAVIDFVVLFMAYGAKLVMEREAVRAEFHHPIAGTMFATVLMSLLLLPLVVAPVSLGAARALWCVGAAGMLAFALYVVSRWMNATQQPLTLTPAWIMPVVGMLDVPLAVPALALPQLNDSMLLGLSVGLFFAVPLFTMIFHRLVFEAPLPARLQPTLLILVAPFSVGMLAYVAATDRVDLFARALYLLMLFVLAVLLGRLRHLPQCSFKVAWWAVSFPLASSASAALRMAISDAGWGSEAVAILLLGLATISIAWLVVGTLLGIARGELGTLID